MPPGMGGLADVTEDLSAFGDRPACSDAERRAALWLHDELRERGHEAWVETVWVRPAWAWSLAAHAVLGVAGSLLASTAAVAGLVVCAVASVSYALELVGFGGILGRVAVRRATQVVVVEPADPSAVAVWIHAATDTPRTGIACADRARALGARLVPGPFTWAGLLLALVTAAAAARVAAPAAGSLGILQLVPTVGLLVAVAAGVDAALSAVSPGAGEAAGVAVALALHDELCASPLPGLSAGLVLGGAGELRPLGLKAWLRDAQPDPARTLLLDVGPCGGGEVAWSARRPQLRAAFEDAVVAGGPDAATGDRPAGRRRGLNRPSALRLRRLPVVALRAVDPARGVPPRARTGADTVAATDEAAAERVLGAALTGLSALELQPLGGQARSRAKATNQS